MCRSCSPAASDTRSTERARWTACLPMLLLGRQLPLDIAGDQLDGEQVAEVADLGVPGELAEVGKGHLGPQLVQAAVGDLAVLDELGIALENRFREQLAARDLDAKLALQAEDDVEKIDRFGSQVSLQ